MFTGLENTFGDLPLENKGIGNLIKWVIKDFMSEEMDTMVKNNLEPKVYHTRHTVL